MKSRRFKPECEPLERRDVPDAAAWQGALFPHPIPPSVAAEIRELEPKLEFVPASRSSHWQGSADFSEELEVWLRSLQPAQGDAEEGVQFLLNYARKSVRNRHIVKDQDQADLVQNIYLEWTSIHGEDPAAPARLLRPDSQERVDLRYSVYRVLDRYRYAQRSNRCLDMGMIDPEDRRHAPATDAVENRLDLQGWLSSLSAKEAQVIQKHYFEFQTIENIGQQMGLAKQRISEIHRRALERHPDFADGKMEIETPPSADSSSPSDE